MEEQKSMPSFEANIREVKKDVQLDVFDAKEALSGLSNEPIKEILAEDILKMMSDLKDDIVKATTPEEIFQKALKGMDNLDKKNFLLDNLLEGLKRGDTPAKLLHRYDKLGLLDLGERQKQVEAMSTDENDLSSNGLGRFIQKLKMIIRRSGLTMTALISPALKGIPKLLKLEHKVTFGKHGLIPEISFGVGSDIGTTLQDLIEIVKDAWWEAGLIMEHEVGKGTNPEADKPKDESKHSTGKPKK